MSVYDAFTQSQAPKDGSVPSASAAVPASPTASQGPEAAAPVSTNPVTPPATQSVYDSFKATQTSAVKPPAAVKSSGSVYDGFKAAKAPLSVPSPYFYSKDPSGVTLGASSQLDSSGKPMLGYRNPGDTATSTDTTRVATTFDPRIPQKLSPDTFLTPRAVAARAALKQSMGGTYSDELDHVISLELSGSNDKSNLQIEPAVDQSKPYSGSNQTATDPLENSLARDVASGKTSLFDAQAQLAKAKGKPAPWGTDSNKEGWIQKTWDGVKNFFLPQAHAQTSAPSATKSVYDSFKDTQSNAAPATSLKSPDDFNTESIRLDSISNDLDAENTHLQSLKSNLDTSNQKAIDAYNSEIDSFNQKLGQYKSEADTYNKAVGDYQTANPVTGQSIGEAKGAAGPENQSIIDKARNIPVVGDIMNATDSVVNDAVGSINDLLSEWSSDKTDSAGEAFSTVAAKALHAGSDIAFSPASIGLNALNKVPVIGPLVKGIGVLLGNIGDAGSSVATDAVNALPIADNYKQDLLPLAKEAGALGAQIIAGDIATGAHGIDAAGTRLADLQAKMRDTIVGGVGEMQQVSAWKTLGSPKSLAELETNYRQLAQQVHPDKPGGNADAMKSLNQAKALIDDKGLPSTAARARNAVRQSLNLKDKAPGADLNLKRLPGYAPIAQPLMHAGLSTEPIEPVGFGDNKPLSPAEQKTADAFTRSSGQEIVGKIGDSEVSIGSYGKNAIDRKTTNGQEDRLPISEIGSTLPYASEKYVAGNTGFRKDNIVHIAKMPSGEARAIITRKNAAGKEEVINFFRIGRDYNKFVDNLKSFGIPTGTRTRMTPLEPEQSSPLAYGDNSTVPNSNEKVNVPAYKGEDDLTTSILQKLQGRTTVSKQFISDLTNSADLKQTERDIVRQVLSEYSDGKDIPVQEFADKVKAELLPLTTTSPRDMYSDKPSRGLHENVSLDKELRGPVENYQERIYQSPIKTSAGSIHFPRGNGIGSSADNYFGHTRIEDMAPDSYKPGEFSPSPSEKGTTRRIIEVQSDLYQKGGLENEGLSNYDISILKNGENFAAPKADEPWKPSIERQKEIYKEAKEKSVVATEKMKKLTQYSNPTAHFRMVREEVKQAAIDGKTKLQFPTGETAMKIEGLGEPTNFYTPSGTTVKPEYLTVGMRINNRGGGSKWIVTDVLGDGKFKAVPESYSIFHAKEKLGEKELEARKETFDISGKVDTSNPIYRFYEKDLGRYLKNKYDAKLITDKQGVTWYEMDVPKNAAEEPVTAFKVGKKLGYNRPIEEVRKAIYKQIPQNKVQLIFTKDPIKGFADGTYQGSINPHLAPIIKIMESNGKASVFTGLHEVAHYVLDPKNGLTTASERADILKNARNTMGAIKKADKLLHGYRGDKVAEEYVADEWAKQKASEDGFHGPLKRALDLFNRIIQKIMDTYRRVRDALDKMLPQEGRQGGYIGFGKKPGEEAPKISPEEEAAMDMNVINQKHAIELDELTERGFKLEMQKESLDQNPAKQLAKYVPKSGEFKGRLREVTGGPEAKGIFAKRGDDIVTELGFKDSESARTAWEKYADSKEKYEKDVRAFKADKAVLYKKFIEDAQKYNSSTTHPAGRYDLETTEANRGVVPPIVRGGIQAPEMDLTKFKDMMALRLGRDTMERNIEKTAGPYADELKDFLIDPVRANEVDRIKYMNEIRQDLRAKLKEWGIKRRSKEEDLIQRYGEGYVPIDKLRELTLKWKEVMHAADYFRKVYDQVLDKANEERGKYWYSAIPKRQEYFRHFTDMNEFTNIFGILRSDGQLPTTIAGMTHIFRPGKPFSTAELPRLGNQTSYAAIGGMDNWIDSMSRQIFHINSVQRGRALEKYIRSVAKENPGLVLPNLVQNVQEWTNLVSGKAAMLDRSIEATIGRPIMKAMKKLADYAGKNIIAGNLSVAMTHLVSMPLNVATVDKVPFTRALLHTLISPLKKEPITNIDGVESSFLLRRYPEKYILPTKFQKASETLSWIFHITDVFKSKTTVASKYYEGIGKGLSKDAAMADADKYAGRIIGDSSVGNQPNLMNTHTTKIIAQFQLGVNDGLSVLLHDIPHWEKGNKSKIASRLVAFAIFSFLFNQLYKKIRGSGKGLDPIDAGLTLTGLNEEGNGQGFMQRLSLAGGDIAGELPFTSIFTGTFPLATSFSTPIKQIIQGDVKGGAETLASTFASPIGGGVQAKKTIEGLQAFNAGQTSTGTGQEKTPVDKTPLNAVKAAVFGASALNAQNGSASELKRLQGLIGAKTGSVTKQAEDQYAQMKGMSQPQAAAAFDALMQSNPALAKRIEQISTEDKLGITQNERMIKQLNVSLGVRAKYIYDKMMALPDDASRAKMWDDYTAKKIISPQVEAQLLILLKK